MSSLPSGGEPFDPLAVENIGVTLAVELLEQPLHPLPPAASFPGAGVYVIYYNGGHEAYEPLRALERDIAGWRFPVYIGSAVRENAKQGFNPQSTSQSRLFTRLRDHAASIRQATNLDIDDFECRFLVLNDAFITLAESVMITTFQPVWNGMGFGSKVVGANRTGGAGSYWDALHPGRSGRPAGTEETSAAATQRIATVVDALGREAADKRTARMVHKIRRFLQGSA